MVRPAASRLQISAGMNEIADRLRARTHRYLIRIIRFCQRLPDRWTEREIGKQLLRAGMGVTGNYWSACRGRSDKEFIAKLGVAADEADEAVLWLTAILDVPIRNDQEPRELSAEGQELRAILSKSHKTARENRKKDRAGRKKCANSPTH
jgi:four helix bundle protein